MTIMMMPRVYATVLPPMSTRMPEQSLREVEPLARLYEIPGHFMHSPKSEYVPVGQGQQSPLPSSELVPGGHRAQTIDPFLENVPAGHALHTARELARCCSP